VTLATWRLCAQEAAVPAPVIRPIGPDEVDLFTSFTDASPLGLKPPLAMYLDGLHQWYRPEWSWVALGDGQVVARVASAARRRRSCRL
jgi:hypothetical protein